MFECNGMNESFPIYTTRKSGGGTTMSYSQSFWITLLVLWMVELNIILWSAVGVYEFVKFVVETV